jgi:PAS domain S-box-containing protein
MIFQYTPHTVPLTLAALLAAVGGVNAWRRRKGPLEIWGTIVQLMLTVWALVMLFTVSFTGETLKFAAVSLIVPTVLATALAFFVFTVYFVGRSEWLTRERLGLVWTLPIATTLLVATNSVHHLVFRDVTVVSSGSYEQISYTFGPGFYAVGAISYLFCGAFFVLLFQQFRNSRNVYRKISFVLFVSLTILVLTTVPSALQVGPLPHFILLPYTYLVLGLFLIAGTSSVRFLRQLPLERALTVFRPGDHKEISTARATVMEEIDGGIITLDGDGIVVDINTMAKKMIGADRPVGSHVSDVAPAERITSNTAIETVLESKGELRELSEEMWVDAGDEERCYALRVSALSEDDDTGYVVLLHDITGQKRREKALRERERELEQQNERLERQKTQLEHQNERLDRFAGIVSHDLRNPLNVAKGHAGLLGDQIDTADDSALDTDSMDQVIDSLDRMEAIIGDALTLARQGKAITETEPVELGALIESSWSNVDTAQAAIEHPRDVVINADPGRLRNVFENLFRNSVEHGRTDVSITVGLLDDGFFLEDDGSGIPEDRQDQVFEEGFTTSEDGTGFGLAIVHDVVRAHGWDITATTGERGGARFEVTGVDFPWSATTLVDQLDDALDTEAAEQMLAEAMDEAGVDREKFDRETALSLLDDISEQLSNTHAGTAATELAQQLRGTAD